MQQTKSVVTAFAKKQCISPSEKEEAEPTLHKLIVAGLNECIARHTNKSGGTRTTAAETLVKNVVCQSNPPEI